MSKNNLDLLCKKFRSLLDENRYKFSDADRVLLEEILLELEEMADGDSPDKGDRTIEVLSLIIRYLKFLGIDSILDLF